MMKCHCFIRCKTIYPKDAGFKELVDAMPKIGRPTLYTVVADNKWSEADCRRFAEDLTARWEQVGLVSRLKVIFDRGDLFHGHPG